MTGVATRTATRGGTKRVAVLVVAVVAALADLAAKVASEGRLAENPVDRGLLQLRLAHNSGVAFSMGNTLPVAVIVAVTAVICLALAAYAWRRAPQAGWVERLAGGAVIGGAVANVVDRARDGVVTDYLHTGWWPTFNLADTFVVTGGLAIALLHVRHEQATDTSDEPCGPTPDDQPSTMAGPR